MKRIRQFWLQNEHGSRYGLNGENGAFVSDLDSLGYALSPVFAGLSHGFFSPVATDSVPQGTPGTTVWFTRSPYTEYQRFVNFLATAQQLSLAYNPTGTQEYLMDVTVANLQKGELNEVGWLGCPLTYYSCSPWYQPRPTELMLEKGSDESKRYDYEYTEALMYGNDAASNLQTEIYGAGHIPGALALTYYGGITNPKIRLVGKLSGRTYGLCSVAVTVDQSERLCYSSRHNDSYIRLITGTGEERDLLDVLDLSSQPFAHLPINEPCTISIESDTVITGHADLLIYYYFRSV